MNNPIAKASHTPGPWRFLEEGDTESKYNRGKPLTVSGGPEADDLVNVYSRDDATTTISRSEAIANAHLIAAAPDLLAELQRITDHLETWANDHSGERTAETDAAIFSARTAITLATH